jgi:diguanylate cyclase (GGDEF)-like protein/PAS domain S-box-containing protein
MLRIFKSPLVRLSFGIVMLTISLLLMADLIGLSPDAYTAELQSRKVIAESLAVQMSGNIIDGQDDNIKATLHSVVERNDNVLSAALRRTSGELFAISGMHNENWTLGPDDSSTPTQIQVPLINSEGRWGNIELRLSPLNASNNFLQSSQFLLILFMTLAGFIVYLLFLKHSLRELNPDAVIPERVRAALDTLAEGLLIIDQNDFVVFSNKSFADKVGLSVEELIGKKSNSLGWEQKERKSDSKIMPWDCLLKGEEMPKEVTVKLKAGLKKARTLRVNASPIMSTADDVKGALITFDDITSIESKNKELNRAMDKLEHSQREITRQNKELQVLATRDPLTNSLNRRSLFQGFDTLFEEAIEHDEVLSCIMVDIDHFKAVNDNFGHSVGDTVIKYLAALLTEYSRPNDLVGRFGGEEFVIVLPNTSIEDGAVIADRIRQAIQDGDKDKLPKDLSITSSFGVSSLVSGASDPKELVDQADAALYVAKEGGRNRVVMWSAELANDSLENTDLETKQEVTTSTVVNQSQPSPVTDIKTTALSSNDEPITSIGLDTKKESNTEIALKQEIGVDNAATASSKDMAVLFDRIDQSIKRAQRNNTQTAVMILSVDALQRIQDTMGMAVLSKFSKTMTSRLKEILRDTDIVSLAHDNELLFSISRLGNNDIVLLLADLEDINIINTIIQRIFASQSKPVEVEGHEIYLDTDIGVSVFPTDGEDMDTLVKNASSAMRAGKKSGGRNNFRFYSDDINKHSRHQMRLETDLHHAIERNEFIVYYQPKIDIKTGEITSMEALIRWVHPQLGLVNPNDFIPLAEQTCLIDEITVWVIREVSKQINIWNSAGHEMISVAVNLSAVQFRNPQLGDDLVELFQDLGVQNNAIELEVTETAVVQNMDSAINSLNKLSEAGVHISLDDFGTGYSSLNYLKRFPLHTIKIDRSFIIDLMHGANDVALVSAIIAMSKALNLNVIAEGVETLEQLRLLQDMGCDQIQGYLTAKPMPSHEALNLLSDSSDIKQLITEYSCDQTVFSNQESFTSMGTMFGVVNNFTETAKERAIIQLEKRE